MAVELLKEKFRELDVILIAAVALIIMLQRFIMMGELSDGFAEESTDTIRYLLLTLALPVAVLVFGILSISEGEDEPSMLKSVFETLALTIFIVIALLNLFTIQGTGILTGAAIIFFYPFIIIFLAIYRIATWNKD